jgi:hypothetical protein
MLAEAGKNWPEVPKNATRCQAETPRSQMLLLRLKIGSELIFESH